MSYSSRWVSSTKFSIQGKADAKHETKCLDSKHSKDNLATGQRYVGYKYYLRKRNPLTAGEQVCGFQQQHKDSMMAVDCFGIVVFVVCVIIGRTVKSYCDVKLLHGFSYSIF